MTPSIMPAGPDVQLRVGWSENSVRLKRSANRSGEGQGTSRIFWAL